MKPLFVISSPFDTYSGYGARSRDLIKAIIETDKYNVRLMSQRWGNTPFGFCKDNPEWEFLLGLILPNNQLPKQPEIWAQVTVPNEFQPIGKYNIGFTAGIETTICAPQWIEGINRMNLTLVSSEHSKKVFQASKFEQRNQAGQTTGAVELKTPIEILFEGADLSKYFQTTEKLNYDVCKDLDTIPENFCYLFVGHWLQGEFGEDRKNVGYTIKAFLEVFKNKKTNTQTRKDRIERGHNTQHLFGLKKADQIREKRLLLVDDIITTGATAESAGRCLLEANPASLHFAAAAYTLS